MQFHATSLCEDDRFARVYLVGLEGEKCYPNLERHEGTKLAKCLISPTSLGKSHLRRISKMSKAMFIALAPVRALVQALEMLRMLLTTVGPVDVFLVQNPPSTHACYRRCRRSIERCTFSRRLAQSRLSVLRELLRGKDNVICRVAPHTNDSFPALPMQGFASQKR